MENITNKILKELLKSDSVVRSNLENKKFEIETSSKIIIEISIFTHDKVRELPDYNENRFEIFIVRHEYEEINHHIDLKFNSNTIGFIFTLPALTSANDYDNYKGIYAHAAIEKILNYGIVNKFLKEIEITTIPFLIDFEELLIQNNIAIAIIGKEKLEEFDVKLDEVKLNVIRKGYIPLSNIFSDKYNYRFDSELTGFNVKKIDPFIFNNIGSFLTIFELSDTQIDPFSKFITLYQVIEILINSIFPEMLENISNNVEIKKDPFKFREKLEALTKESTRIKSLKNDFMDHELQESECFENFRLIANRLLDNIFPKYRKKENGDYDYDSDGNKIQELYDESWALALYKLRNHLVHGQSNLYGKIEDDLQGLCSLLKKCCIDLLRAFKRPAYAQQAIE